MKRGSASKERKDSDMSAGDQKLSGPDFEQGIEGHELADGALLLGHAQGEPVLMARRGAEVCAIGATCTHYSGPLAGGLPEGDTVRCPWHHACFNLRTGRAERAPALNPVPCFEVERRGERLVVLGKKTPDTALTGAPGHPSSIVIV